MSQPHSRCKTLLVRAVSFRLNFLVPLSLCFLTKLSPPKASGLQPQRLGGLLRWFQALRNAELGMNTN